MYWMPMLTFARRPSSVRSSPAEDASRSSSAVTETSGRCLSIWLGLSPSTASNASIATGTESGCATHEPSKPSFASRRLSSPTCLKAFSLIDSSLRLGMNADMPPIANAPRLWQVCTSSSV
jgi:hypothetical protein